MKGKRFNAILAMLLMAVIAVVLNGCGGGGSTTKDVPEVSVTVELNASIVNPIIAFTTLGDDGIYYPVQGTQVQLRPVTAATTVSQGVPLPTMAAPTTKALTSKKATATGTSKTSQAGSKSAVEAKDEVAPTRYYLKLFDGGKDGKLDNSKVVGSFGGDSYEWAFVNQIDATSQELCWQVIDPFAQVVPGYENVRKLDAAHPIKLDLDDAS